jgi:hypothetical protein
MSSCACEFDGHTIQSTADLVVQLLTQFARPLHPTLLGAGLALCSVEPASSIIRSARTNMVLRLNSYASEYRDLFTQALNLINSEFMHIVKRQVRRS